MDQDENGCLSFDEFACYFVRTAEAIMRFRKKQTSKKAAPKSKTLNQMVSRIEVPESDEVQLLTDQADGGSDRYWYQFRLGAY